MKPSVLLAKAKHILVENGWCQNAWHKAGDGYCAGGAILHASGMSAESLTTDGEEWDIDLYNSSKKHFERILKVVQPEILWCTIDMWNDEKGRTKKQVLAAFDKAIKLARASGE